MPSSQTQNYKLSQWVKTDKVLMDDFNADNLAIDAALTSKAEQSALTALQTTVSKKAEQLDVSALQTALAGKGNCQIYAKTYTGKDTFGPDNQNSITFPAKPEVVLLGSRENFGTILIALYGQTHVSTIGSTLQSIYLSWSGNTLSWYSTFNADSQLNDKGSVYPVIALMLA